MGSERFDDEIWDEFRWEQHINAIERKSVQLKDFISSTWGENSPSWVRLLGEYKNQNDVIDAFIEEELMFEEAYFPEDDDWDDDDEDDPDNDLFMSDEEDDDFFNQLLNHEEGDEDEDEDDERSTSFKIEDIEFLEDMVAYNLARSFGIKVLGLARRQKESNQDAIFNQFIQTSLQISAKLAAGFSFGFDLEVIGGNITYCKKALENANRALELLHMLKHRPWMKAAEYYELDEELFEVRNEIGMYIQDLRETYRNSLF